MGAHHGVAGLGIERLMGGSMEDDAIDTLGKPIVANAFEGEGGFVASAGEGFGPDDGFTIGMGG